jgi:hypothetical protein
MTRAEVADQIVRDYAAIFARCVRFAESSDEALAAGWTRAERMVYDWGLATLRELREKRDKEA